MKIQCESNLHSKKFRELNAFFWWLHFVKILKFPLCYVHFSSKYRKYIFQSKVKITWNKCIFVKSQGILPTVLLNTFFLYQIWEILHSTFLLKIRKIRKPKIKHPENLHLKDEICWSKRKDTYNHNDVPAICCLYFLRFFKKFTLRA